MWAAYDKGRGHYHTRGPTRLGVREIERDLLLSCCFLSPGFRHLSPSPLGTGYRRSGPERRDRRESLGPRFPRLGRDTNLQREEGAPRTERTRGGEPGSDSLRGPTRGLGGGPSRKGGCVWVGGLSNRTSHGGSASFNQFQPLLAQVLQFFDGHGERK